MHRKSLIPLPEGLGLLWSNRLFTDGRRLYPGWLLMIRPARCRPLDLLRHNTTISPRPALRFAPYPSTLGLPARPLCPSRFVPTVASTLRFEPCP